MLFFQVLARCKRVLSLTTVAAICVVALGVNAQPTVSNVAPAALGVDPEFNASVATTSNLTINASATQADGKIVIGGTFSIGGNVPRNSIARLDTSGNLDPTFNNGIGTSGTASTQRVNAIAIQTDGKIIVGGNWSQFNGNNNARSFVRLNSDGSIDTGFLQGLTSGEINAMTIQPDGKILVVGDFFQINGVARNRIARINIDGTVDSTFVIGSGPSNSVNAVAYQADGKVLVGGGFSYNSDNTMRSFVRLNSNGSLDTSFNNTRDIVGRVYAIAALSDGKILIGGSLLAYGGVIRDRLARLNEDGTLDSSFTASANGDVQTLVVQPDGKILLGGGFGSINGVPTSPVARINANGTNDATFTASVNFTVNSIHIQPSGGIVATGGFWQANNVTRNAVAKFDSTGQLDNGFDPIFGLPAGVTEMVANPDGSVIIAGEFNVAGGLRRTRLAKVAAAGSVDESFDSGTGASGEIMALARQADGKILVGGDFATFSGSTQRSLVRLNPNGSLDNSFSIPGGVSSRVRTIKILADGRIAIGGEFSFVGGVQRPNIAILNPNGSLDTTFTPDIDSGVYEIVQQPDGKILVGGVFSLVNSQTRYRLVRLLANGSLDPAYDPQLIVGGQGVFTMDLDSNGKLVIGGFFSGVTGVSSNNIARLNSDGTVDTSFHIGTGAGFTVWSVAHQPNGRIIVAGDFATFNGVLQRGVVRLRESGAIDQTFRPTVARNGAQNPTLYKALVTQDPTNQFRGKLFLGGWFTSVDGLVRIGVARMTLSFLNAKTAFDFDGDDKTDIGIFRPSGGEWWINRSGDGQTFALQFGSSTDVITPADYTGDGKTDIAFFRPSSGQWFVLRSEDSSFFALPFGTNGDIPVPADYDADGKADFAVFRPSSSTWFISQSSGAATRIVQFGSTGDQPVVSDYDGDGKADIGIFRQAAGGAEWWIDRSTAGLLAMQFGASTDKAVQGDYTGDGKADIAIWRPSTGEWFIVRSEDFSFYGFPFGTTGDVVAPGDYDGDGKVDVTVFRPSSATWFISRTTAGTQIVQFGATGDRPLPNAFVR